MNKNFKTTAQGGFTLIELIVVIVILGILAATALPKFSSLGGDARVATLNAMRGSLASVATMTHGHALAAPTAGSLKFEQYQVAIVNGYPAATTPTANAAGADANNKDFTIIGPNNTANGTNGPTTTAKQIAIVPAAVAGTANAANCYVMYTEAVDAQTPPVIALGANTIADNCN